MATLEIRGLKKRFAGATALDGFDLKVESGTFAVVLGASGSGKTTLLRLIAGLESVDSGEIDLAGERINDREPRLRDIAMVFQQDNLLPHLSVSENLEFPLRMQRLSGSEVRQRAHETAQRLGITDLLGRRPDELSGGQRQRVALGRALVRRPRLFLLDEPLSQLDTPLRSGLRDELKRLQRDLQVTTVLVTHDQGEAMQLADQLVVLDGHRCVQQGQPTEVYDRPASPAIGAFLGSPPMNFLPCRSEGTKCEIAGTTIDCPSAVAERPTLVGIRPERLVVANAEGSSADDSTTICWLATVDGVAELGFDSVIDVTLKDGSQLKARIVGRSAIRPGQKVLVNADPDDVRWFTTPT